MAHVISLINMKGGVGKTHLTVALAEFMATRFGKKVLVIDMDPQTNATLMLISERVWEERNSTGRTLLQLFLDRLRDTDEFDIDEAIIKGVSNLRRGVGHPNIDLLPSSIGLMNIQDRIPSIPSGEMFIEDPTCILFEAIEPVLGDYDYVLIDCPPSLNVMTLNGIYLSDYFLIPAVPNAVSTLGIPQILNRMRRFCRKKQRKVEPLGIVISMFRKTADCNKFVKFLKEKAAKGEYPRIFKTRIPLSTSIAETGDYSKPQKDVTRKYRNIGYKEIWPFYEDLTKEVLGYVEGARDAEAGEADGESPESGGPDTGEQPGDSDGEGPGGPELPLTDEEEEPVEGLLNDEDPEEGEEPGPSGSDER